MNRECRAKWEALSHRCYAAMPTRFPGGDYIFMIIYLCFFWGTLQSNSRVTLNLSGKRRPAEEAPRCCNQNVFFKRSDCCTLTVKDGLHGHLLDRPRPSPNALCGLSFRWMQYIRTNQTETFHLARRLNKIYTHTDTHTQPSCRLLLHFLVVPRDGD